MKTRTLVSISILILAVMFIAGSCATTHKCLISKGEPLSIEKAYLAGVFSYSSVGSVTDDPHVPELHLKGDNKKHYWMSFPKAYDLEIYGPNPTPVLTIFEVEPGEYKARNIIKQEDYTTYFLNNIMDIPPRLLRCNITAERGSVTYLGDFSIKRHYNAFFSTVRFESSYVYDFKKFQNKIEQEYIVPENFRLKKL